MIPIGINRDAREDRLVAYVTPAVPADLRDTCKALIMITYRWRKMICTASVAHAAIVVVIVVVVVVVVVVIVVARVALVLV